MVFHAIKQLAQLSAKTIIQVLLLETELYFIMQTRALCVLPVLSHQLLQRQCTKGQDLIKLIIETASSETFFSEAGFFFSLWAHGGEEYVPWL